MKRIAKVIDNKDPDKLGKIKVQVLPELDGISEKGDLLPWASYKQDFNMKDSYKQDIPSVGDYIVVEVNDTWTEFSYSDEYPYTENKDILNKAYEFLEEISDLQSKKDGAQPSKLKYSNSPQRLIFEDSETGEMGIIFPNKRFVWFNGSQIIFGDKNNKYIELNEDGSLKAINTSKKSSIEIKSNGNIDIICQDSTKVNMTSGAVEINGHFKVTV